MRRRRRVIVDHGTRCAHAALPVTAADPLRAQLAGHPANQRCSMATTRKAHAGDAHGDEGSHGQNPPDRMVERLARDAIRRTAPVRRPLVLMPQRIDCIRWVWPR